ncbi:MAG: hypothetical protein WCS74_01745 [Dehalococcoidales bacterium]|nr:hypothetical protein [Limnochordia bacterium]MDD2252478.1 hypothetical protein [Dehalococcoidales bacterium]MDD5499010.1 hypothetical protein [Dehalococcoidales bacterium]
MKLSRAVICIGISAILAAPLLFSACSNQASQENQKAEAILAAQQFIASSGSFAVENNPCPLTLMEVRQIGSQADEAWEVVYQFEADPAKPTWNQSADTPVSHKAVVTVENRKVTSAVIDGKLDIVAEPTPGGIDIHMAPVHEVAVDFMESDPIQVGVHIQLGLRSGCTTFHDAVINREAGEIQITVTAQEPVGVACPAIYIFYDKYINLGTEFASGQTYTLVVNEYTTSFTMQ